LHRKVEVAVAYFKSTIQHFPGVTEEDHRNFIQSDVGPRI